MGCTPFLSTAGLLGCCMILALGQFSIGYEVDLPILSTANGECCEWNKYQQDNYNGPDNTNDPDIVLHT